MTKSETKYLSLDRFSKLLDKKVTPKFDFDEQNDLYIQYRKSIKKYYQTGAEWIDSFFDGRIPYRHTNWLKSKERMEHAIEVLFPTCEGAKCKIQGCLVCKNEMY